MVKKLDVTRYLDGLGIKHANRGFKYLTEVISIGLEKPELVYRINDLYKTAASVYGGNEVLIERSIRYSIKDLNITNKEFITRAIDYFDDEDAS